MSRRLDDRAGDRRHRPAESSFDRFSDGRASDVQRSSAVHLNEIEPLFDSYEHLQGLPRGETALTMLRKVASLVKPIMRKRRWRVQTLAEFFPKEQNLLGLNVNKGWKICLRLRYHYNPDLFLPLEEVVDTMLHELSHIVWGEHDSNFHRLWDELRDEHEALARKGYTGEGFLSRGQRLGGTNSHRGPLALHEMRHNARISAETRKIQGTLNQGSGQRLGGKPLHLQGDIRQIITDQVARRNAINKGCGYGRLDADQLSQHASLNSFKNKAEEDDANNRAIAQALMELMEEDEAQAFRESSKSPAGTGTGLAWSADRGLHDPSLGSSVSGGSQTQASEEEQLKWALEDSLKSSDKPQSIDSSSKTQQPKATDKEIKRDCRGSAPLAGRSIRHEMLNTQTGDGEVEPLVDLASISNAPDGRGRDGWICAICTLHNPTQFLACDACAAERPQACTKKARSEVSSKQPKLARVQEKVADRSSTSFPETSAPEHSRRLGWNCSKCGAFMEHKWWTCSACGSMKETS